jgi:hypothetical protein
MRQQRPIVAVVVVREEHVLPPVAPLGDMMRQPRHHNARQTSHRAKLLEPASLGN